MKKIIIALTLLSGMTQAATDFVCMGKCTSSGYMYQYCQSACSYNSQPKVQRTDYTCMSNCSENGYQYGYCKSTCSY